MAKKIFVAGLPYSVSDEQLKTMFSQFGEVDSAKIITDRDTGRSKGFGFVEMSSDNDCVNAITSLNNTQFEGRSLIVKEARPKEESSRNSFNSSFKSRSAPFGSRNRGGSNRKY